MRQPKPQIVTNRIAERIMSALLLGFIVVGLVTSPFALYVLVSGVTKMYFRKRDFNRELGRLKKRGYVALTKKEQGWLVKLLPKGKNKLKEIQFRNLRLQNPKQWDGNWRLFSFDIPENQRTARNRLRRKLKQLGLLNVQRSLFVHPHDCRKELAIVSDYYGLTKYTTYAEAQFLDIDKQLRKHFNL